MAESEAERIKPEAYRLHHKRWLNPEHAESASQGFYSLSPYAEAFRGKLLHHFRLLEQISGRAGSSTVVDDPIAATEDLLTVDRHRVLLRERPYANVVASPYSADKRRVYSLTHADHFIRQRRKMENKLSMLPPISIFSHWLLNLPLFQLLVFVLIILNAITLAASAEFSSFPSTDPNYSSFQTAIKWFDVFDKFTLAVFTLEILLKFSDDFHGFWDNAWNLFDLAVTAISYLPLIMEYAFPSAASIATTDDGSGSTLADASSSPSSSSSSSTASAIRVLKVFRNLRLLKILTRNAKTRLLAAAITTAFKDLVYIGILFILFVFIFAVIGVQLFFEYSTVTFDGDQDGPKNRWVNAFISLPWAAVTLFQIFTIDHWYELNKQLSDYYASKNNSTQPVLSVLYQYIWLLLGSFIFRNIIIGTMVTSFQGIRTAVSERTFEQLEHDLTHDAFQHFFRYLHTERMGIVRARDSAVTNLRESLSAAEAESQQQRRVGGDSFTNFGDGNPFIHFDSDAAAQFFHEHDQHEAHERMRPGLRLAAITSEHEQEHANNMTRAGHVWLYNLMQNFDLMDSLAHTQTTTWTKELIFNYFIRMEMLIDSLQERREIIRMMDKLLISLLESDDPAARPDIKHMRRAYRAQKHRASVEQHTLTTVLNKEPLMMAHLQNANNLGGGSMFFTTSNTGGASEHQSRSSMQKPSRLLPGGIPADAFNPLSPNPSATAAKQHKQARAYGMQQHLYTSTNFEDRFSPYEVLGEAAGLQPGGAGFGGASTANVAAARSALSLHPDASRLTKRQSVAVPRSTTLSAPASPTPPQ